MHLRLILSCFLCSAVLAQAQTQLTPAYFQRQGAADRFHRHVATLLERQSATLQAKTTGTGERLKAEVSVFANNQVFDTTSYQYSGSRGSAYDFSYMSYNDLYSLSISPQSYPYLPGSLAVKADTLAHWENDNGNFMLTKATRTSYTGNGSIDAYREYNFNANAYDWSDQHCHVYANNRLQEIRTLSDFSSGNMDSLDKTLLLYDGQGRLDKQLIYTLDNTQWREIADVDYIYDNNGRLTGLKTIMDLGSGWFDQSELVHTYYPDGRISTVVLYENDGSALAPSVKDSFVYSGNLPWFSKLTEWGFDPGVQQWVNAGKIEKTISQQGLPDTVCYYEYDGQAQDWKDLSRLELSYTAQGNPEFIYAYSDPSGTGNLSYFGKYHYYYEPYTTTGTEPVPARIGLSVFPNPAGDEVTLRFDRQDEYEVTVMDMAGKQLLRRQMNGQELVISLKELPAGAYLLNGGSGRGQQTVRLVRQ